MSLTYDALYTPYASQRNVIYGKKAMVATSQPLAASAGLDIMKKGGNAIDASIATAAALTVVEPTSNGIGGDAFALVWVNGKLHGLNSSGPAPKNISIAKVREKGYSEMPKFGWTPVTVPGVPAAWVELSKRFGKLTLSECLAPAISYAREGYPISPTLGRFWKRAVEIFSKNLIGDEFNEWFKVFAPSRVAPAIGEIWSSPDHGNTLEKIGESYAESFYRGEIAEKIVSASTSGGGFFTYDDLASYAPSWVTPIKVNYRGYDVWEIPPNGHGIVALMALNIMQGFSVSENNADTLHKQIEAMKLAFSSGKAFVTDSHAMNIKAEQLLDPKYALACRNKIGEQANTYAPVTPPKGGTVYLATADNEGNMVSFIQSNYMGFGSGIVIPGTGIAMQNRGFDFSLDEGHINCLVGGKRSYHTIIPGFLTKDNEAIGPFGVMGGYMQPQGHMQVIMNTLDFGLNPQAALDAPRWQWIKEKTVQVEKNFPTHLALELKRRGHNIEVALDSGVFGRGQIIWRNPQTGVLAGGTESRTDGHIAVW